MESGISRGQSAGRASGVGLALALLLCLGCPADDPTPDPEEPPGCAEGQIDDGGSCVPVECGTGTWGWLDEQDLAGTIHVAPDGSSDGDGSRDAPLDSAQAGFDLAVSTGAPLVALAAGSWQESLQLAGGDQPVELRGRCSALVELRAGSDRPGGSITAGGLTLAGLTLSGGAHGVDIDPPPSQPSLIVTLRDRSTPGTWSAPRWCTRSA